MKNKIFVILIIALLFLPVNVQADDSYANPAIENIEEEAASPEALPEQDNVEIPSEAALMNEEFPKSIINPYKQPVSKREIAKRFLRAMLGVVISSFVIFFMLSVYNKIREKFINQVKTGGCDVSLSTPDDLDGAVKTFLDKTVWK